MKPPQHWDLYVKTRLSDYPVLRDLIVEIQNDARKELEEKLLQCRSAMYHSLVDQDRFSSREKKGWGSAFELLAIAFAKIFPDSPEGVESHSSKFALIKKATTAIETYDKGIEWLLTPQYGLGNAAPWDYADKKDGVKAVTQLLDRIEQGVY